MVRGVILAAGLSQRMGTLKQLLPYQGKPLLQHVIDSARASALDHLLLVLGAQYDRILPHLDLFNVTVVYNKEYAAGQSTSVRAGLAYGPDTSGIMFLLGDQPLVQVKTINALIDCFRSRRPLAVVPMYNGQRGNPVIVARTLTVEMDTLQGDVGLRHVVQRARQAVRYLHVKDSGVLRDIDTQEDYQALCSDNLSRYAASAHSGSSRNFC